VVTGLPRTFGLAGAALATFAVAGCTSADTGTAYPVATAESSAAQRSKAADLPQRPADLAIAGIDPCSLLTPAQLDKLAVTSKPRQVAEPVDGPSCSFDADRAKPYYSYGVTVVTSADIDSWLTGSRRKNSMTTQPMAVEGFPALKNFRQSADANDCETLVGVAQGQTLVVQAALTTGGSFTQEQLCDMSTQAATFAVQTLKASK
jgi:hypothetical protein